MDSNGNGVVSLEALKDHLRSFLGTGNSESTDRSVALALLDTSECLVLVLDLDCRVVYANSYCENLLGYSLDEFEGEDWVGRFIHEEFHEDVAERFERAIEGEATKGFVNPVTTRAGRRVIRWFDRVLRGEEGEVVGLLAIGHDITQEREAVAELREVNNRLEELVRERTSSLANANRVLEATLDTSVVCLAYLDTDFNFVRVNAAYAAPVGQEPAWFVGKNHFDLFPNRENEAIFERVRDTGEPYSVQAKPFEYEHAPERGVTHWDWALVPIFDAEEEVVGLVFTLQDVTERVQMVEEAQQREAELLVKETALGSSINGIAIAETDGTISYVNDAFLHLWQLEHESEAVGRHVTDFWKEPETAGQVLGGLLEGGAWFGRLVARLPDEREATMQISANVVVTDGEPIAVMASFVDVTSEVLAAKRRSEQLAEKEVLLREIHHRVKNNLQVISSLLYLQSTRTNSEDARTLFEQSRDRLAAMALVHETLYQSDDLSRVNFEAYVTRLVNAIGASHSAPARGIVLEVSVDCPDMTIEAAVPCGLIINEWVTNALKHAFGARGGRVVVSATTENDGRIRLEVCDNGMGFPTGDDVSDGRIGLKLVDALTEQLGGEMRMARDRGTRLSVVFEP